MERVFAGATVIDGLSDDPRYNCAVTVTDDRITSVGGHLSRDAEVIDLSGLTLLPGLIDAHVHLGHSSDMSAVMHMELSVAERAADIFRNLRETLEAGFTAVRDCGGIDNGVLRTVGRGMVPGPRIWAAAAAIAQCGGHGFLGSVYLPAETDFPHRVRGLTSLGRISDGPHEVRKAARESFRQGASFLKMTVTGGVVSVSDSLEDTQFTVEEIAVAVQEAKARHTYVTIHAHNTAGIRNGVVAGVSCVEHGTGLDEATAAMMADHHVHMVPTLSIPVVMNEGNALIGLPPHIHDRVGDTLARMIDGMHAARAAGVLVGSGSDLIGPNQNRRGLELVLKAKALGAMEAIKSATSVNAKIMRVSDQIGALAPGLLADLVAVDFDPLSEPHLFEDPNRVVLVVKGGHIVKDTRK